MRDCDGCPYRAGAGNVRRGTRFEDTPCADCRPWDPVTEHGKAEAQVVQWPPERMEQVHDHVEHV